MLFLTLRRTVCFIPPSPPHNRPQAPQRWASLSHCLTLGCGHSAGHAVQRFRIRQTCAEDAPHGALRSFWDAPHTPLPPKYLPGPPDIVSRTKPNPITQAQAGDTGAGRRAGEAARGLNFTSTLNQNVKQVIHLLARGTILLWAKDQKNMKTYDRKPRPGSEQTLPAPSQQSGPRGLRQAPTAHPLSCPDTPSPRPLGGPLP